MENEILILSALYAAVLGALFVPASQPLLGVLQQEGYGGRALIRWFYRKKNEVLRRYWLLALCAALITALFALCFSFGGVEVSVVVAMIGYEGAIALFLFAFRRALKVPCKQTARLIRLSVCYALLLAAVCFGLAAGMAALAELTGSDLARVLLRTVPLSALPLVLPVLLAGANLVMKCYEIPHTRRFIRAAKAKLASSDCVKVGITGSFGKTSVKHFAAAMLSKKYRVIATPASYNTPAGIAKCVNEGGLGCDVFLAEMGARKRGDIAELADMVCPSYAIITGICPQHLETFGSVDAIREEKGVLARRAAHVVLGRTAADLESVPALVEGRDFFAKNVVLKADGTEFDLTLGGESVRVKTPLLGRHSAEDVALAGALCHLFGMTLEEIAEGARALKPVPHRLERIEGQNGAVILDDSYNSNVEGAKDAVETLFLFGGKKFVVTPGLVELGELEERANADLGAGFVGLDRVILVGETLILSVRNGYLAAGGSEENLTIVPTLADAQNILAEELSAGDAVLFLNDLPDKYF